MTFLVYTYLTLLILCCVVIHIALFSLCIYFVLSGSAKMPICTCLIMDSNNELASLIVFCGLEL